MGTTKQEGIGLIKIRAKVITAMWAFALLVQQTMTVRADIAIAEILLFCFQGAPAAGTDITWG